MIKFKRFRHAARPSKDLRTSSLFGSSLGPATNQTTGPRNDLTGILVCRRSTGFIGTFGRHTGIHDTPEPSGVRCSANCARRTSVLQGARIPPPSLFGSSPSVSRTLTRVPPGTHRNLRVPPNTSGCSSNTFGYSPNALGRSPATYPSQPGLSRPICTTCGCEDDFGCPRYAVFATEHLRMLTGTSGFHPETLRSLTEASMSTLAVSRR